MVCVFFAKLNCILFARTFCWGRPWIVQLGELQRGRKVHLAHLWRLSRLYSFNQLLFISTLSMQLGSVFLLNFTKRQNESLMLRCQVSFALLQCFFVTTWFSIFFWAFRIWKSSLCFSPKFQTRAENPSWFFTKSRERKSIRGKIHLLWAES